MFLADNLWPKLQLFIVSLMLVKSSYPTQYCQNFVCEKSGLSQVRINQILDKENYIRNKYANTKSISNVHHVDWSRHLALFARRKALLCLYSTDDRNVIFETKIFEEWFGDQVTEKFPDPVAIEVVMGYRAEKINKTAALYLYDELEDDLSDFFRETTFNTPIALRRRGSVLHMGCDYVVRNNGTHIITHLVCAYGLLYFSDGISNDYAPAIGTPCSQCYFYNNRPFFRRSKESDQQWSCMPTFAFLCGDLSLPEKVLPEFRYDCDSSQQISKVAKENVDLVELKDDISPLPTSPSPPYEWPCYRFAIPIILLISMMVAIVIYQILLVTVRKPRY